MATFLTDAEKAEQAQIERLKKYENFLMKMKTNNVNILNEAEESTVISDTMQSEIELIKKLNNERSEKIKKLSQKNNVVTSQARFLAGKQSTLEQIQLEISRNTDELQDMIDRDERYRIDFAHLDQGTQAQIQGSLQQNIQEKKRTLEGLKHSLTEHQSLISQVEQTIKEHVQTLKDEQNNVNQLSEYIDNLERNSNLKVNQISKSSMIMGNHYEDTVEMMKELNELEDEFSKLVQDTPRTPMNWAQKLKALVVVSWKIVNGSILQEQDGTYLDSRQKREHDKRDQIEKQIEDIKSEIEEIEKQNQEALNTQKEALQKQEEIQTQKEIEKQKEIQNKETKEIKDKSLEIEERANRIIEMFSDDLKYESATDRLVNYSVSHVTDKNLRVNDSVIHDVINIRYDESGLETVNDFIDTVEQDVVGELSRAHGIYEDGRRLDERFNHSTNFADMVDDATTFQQVNEIDSVINPFQRSHMEVSNLHGNNAISDERMNEYNKFSQEVANEINADLYWTGTATAAAVAAPLDKVLKQSVKTVQTDQDLSVLKDHIKGKPSGSKPKGKTKNQKKQEKPVTQPQETSTFKGPGL